MIQSLNPHEWSLADLGAQWAAQNSVLIACDEKRVALLKAADAAVNERYPHVTAVFRNIMETDHPVSSAADLHVITARAYRRMFAEQRRGGDFAPSDHSRAMNALAIVDTARKRTLRRLRRSEALDAAGRLFDEACAEVNRIGELISLFICADEADIRLKCELLVQTGEIDSAEGWIEDNRWDELRRRVEALRAARAVAHQGEEYAEVAPDLRTALCAAEDDLMAAPSTQPEDFAFKFLVAFGDGREANNWTDMLEAEARAFARVPL